MLTLAQHTEPKRSENASFHPEGLPQRPGTGSVDEKLLVTSSKNAPSSDARSP